MATAMAKKKAKPKKKPAKSKRPLAARQSAAVSVPQNASRIAAHRESARLYHAKVSLSGRDCGPIADIADVPRREACRFDLKLFCETYNPEMFYLPWAPYQLEGVQKIQEALTIGILWAVAWPRGGAKSALCRMGALWAVSYGHIRYAFVLGANQGKAEENIDAIRKFLRFLPIFAADFPDLVQAIRHLRGIANRASGQVCGGEDQPTMIEWGKDRIVLPTVRPPSNWPQGWPLRPDGMVPTSGSVIAGAGLSAEGIRGALVTLTNGEQIRPDLVLPDDPQTDESADSPTQTKDREDLIRGALLGLRGPGKKLSVIMPMTVIRPGDLAARFLDRERNPHFGGTRVPMLDPMPTNLKAWEAYFEVFDRCALKQPPDYTEANDYYLSRREELDAGAKATWEARIDPPAVSAIQGAMNWFHIVGAEKFASEYQNDPLPDLDLAPGLIADDVAKKVNRLERGTVPIGASHLVSMIDVHDDMLYWLVLGVDDRYTGSVVSYGTWPEQKRDYFTKADAHPKLSSLAPGMSLEGSITAGLLALESHLLDREWSRENGTSCQRIELCLVDSGYRSDIVRGFYRRCKHPTIILPSMGRSIRATQAPIAMWKSKPGDRVPKPGQTPGWRIIRVDEGTVKTVLFDANFFKTFAAARLNQALGERGSIDLFGLTNRQPANHRMLSEHFAMERPKEATSDGRTVAEWYPVKVGQDLHLWDCLIGAIVAAAIQGASVMDAATSRVKRRVVPLSQMGRKRA